MPTRQLKSSGSVAARPGGLCALRIRQRGAALLAVVALIAMLTMSLLLEALNNLPDRSLSRDRKAREALREARAALLGFAVSHPNTPGRMPYPDRAADNKWDGVADCANGTGTIGVALGLGRLPWRGDVGGGATGCPGEADWRLDVTSTLFRDDGLWYAVSRNLLFRSQSIERTPVSWGLVDSAPPYPWLTVRDARGDVISNQVAAVIIDPGPPLEGQSRQWSSSGQPPAVAAYLESIVVGGTVYGNGDADGCPDDAPACGGSDGEDFIVHPTTRDFNDRLVYITAPELLRAVERRIAGEVAVSLESYRAAHGAYPWLSPYRDPAVVDNGKVPLSGWADEGSSGGTLVDLDADFTASGAAGVNVGDLVEIVSDGSTGTVLSVDSPTMLTLENLNGGISNALEVGDGYNIRPAFNGRIKTREGQLAFVDPDDLDPLTAGEQLETFVFNSNFTVDWERQESQAEAEAQTESLHPPGTDFQILPPGLGGIPPGDYLISLDDRQTASANARNALWGLVDDVRVGNIFDGNGDGVCRWSGKAGDLDCRGTRENVGGGYAISLKKPTEPTPYEVSVYRNYEFVLRYSGIPSFGGEENSKTRTVSYDNALSQPPGSPIMTVNLKEYVDSSSIPGEDNDYPLFDLTYTVPVGTAMKIMVSGIAADADLGDELPRFIKDNDWHHYVYVAASEANVSKPASVGGTAGAGSAMAVLTDAGADFFNDQVNAGDFVRNLTANWQGFVTSVDSPSQLTTGSVSRPALRGYARAGSDSSTLVDNSANFVALGVAINDAVTNDTDGSTATVVAVLNPNTLTLSALSGGADNAFQVFDAYSVTRNDTSTVRWTAGDEYAVWRWRCKTTEAADNANPERDCLQLTTARLNNPQAGIARVQNDLRALVVSSGPAMPQTQKRQAGQTSECSGEPKAICDYFGGTNAIDEDDRFEETVDELPHAEADAGAPDQNDEVRAVSTVL